MKNTILTGSEGFIGKHLKKLLDEKETIFMDRKSTFNPIDINGLVDQEEKVFYEGDLVCEDRFEIELIYHLAGQTDVQKSIKAPMKDAVDNILTMIKMATLFPNARIVYTQTSAIQYNGTEFIPDSPYALSKYVAEKYLELLGKNYVVCILPNVYGEGGKGVVDIFKQSEKISVTGNGNQTRSFVYAGDVAEELLRVSKLEQDGRVWEVIVRGEYVSIDELAKWTGKPIEYIDRPSGEVDFVKEFKDFEKFYKPKLKDYLQDKNKKI